MYRVGFEDRYNEFNCFELCNYTSVQSLVEMLVANFEVKTLIVEEIEENECTCE